MFYSCVVCVLLVPSFLLFFPVSFLETFAESVKLVWFFASFRFVFLLAVFFRVASSSFLFVSFPLTNTQYKSSFETVVLIFLLPQNWIPISCCCSFDRCLLLGPVVRASKARTSTSVACPRTWRSRSWSVCSVRVVTSSHHESSTITPQVSIFRGFVVFPHMLRSRPLSLARVTSVCYALRASGSRCFCFSFWILIFLRLLALISALAWRFRSSHPLF